jgi:PAP2 superfamily
MSLADDVIAFYQAKYAYHFWRPVTAIRAAGSPDWTPLLNTPLDPSYPGAHAVISGSAAAVLRQFFGGDRLDFSLTSAGFTRSFQSFSQAADEASESRIFAGAHFRFDLTAGQAMGDEIGDFVFDRLLV